MPEPFAVAWVPRSEPLPPLAAAARGDAAGRLLARLRALSDERLARLEGGVAPGLVVVAGAADDLPWVDGVTYLGRDPGAPEMLVPTTHAATAPAPLVEQALRARASLVGPFAVLLDPLAVVPLGALRRIDRAALER